MHGPGKILSSLLFCVKVSVKSTNKSSACLYRDERHTSSDETTVNMGDIRMRKLTVLLLALALLLGMAPAAVAKSAYTLDIYWIANKDDAEIRSGVEEAINEYLGELYESRQVRSNMKVAFHLIPWDPAWTEQAIGALMNDEKIDLIFTADWEGYVQEIQEGKLTPLGDLLDNYGEDILESLPGDYLEGVRYHGQIYGIPTNKEMCVPTGLIVNKTAAALIGWDPDQEPVSSTEELEPYLARYKELFPARYPYLMEQGRWSDEPWNHDWIGLKGDALSVKYAMDENGVFDETVYSIYETEEQEEHIRLMHRWAQLGYIAPDAATYDYNRIFGTGDFLVFTQPLKGNRIKAGEMYAANKAAYVPDFECTEITLQDRYKVTSQAGGSMFAIPKTCRKKDIAMQYLNLMHSDATLVNLMLFGREDVNYTKVNDSQVELAEDANWYGMHGGAWTVGDISLQYVLKTESPDKNILLLRYSDDAPKTASFGFRFNKKPVSETVKAVEAVVEEFQIPLMVGAADPDDPERGIEAFRMALKEAGIEELKKEVEDQYETWKIETKK